MNEHGGPLLGRSSEWKVDDKGEEQEGSDAKGSLYSFLLLWEIEKNDSHFIGNQTKI